MSSTCNSSVCGAEAEDPYIPDFVERHGTAERERFIIYSPTVKIVSWNVLADRCLRFHPYIQYRPGERNELLRKVFAKLIEMEVDIICLQEVDTGFIEEQVLRGTYRVLATHWGLASCICYRIDTWKLIGDKKVVELNDLAEDNYSPFAETFRRNNHGIIARLQKNDHDSIQIVVCSAHLYWDPEYDYVKLCQAHYLLKETKKFMENYGGADDRAKVFFCGDFNSKPRSKVHTYLTTGELQTGLNSKLKGGPPSKADMKLKAVRWLLQEKLECPLRRRRDYRVGEHSATLNDAYDDETFSNPSLATNFTPDFTGFLDYILYQSEGLILNRLLPLPESKKAFRKQHGSKYLPNQTWPSDHLLVGAEFAFSEYEWLDDNAITQHGICETMSNWD